MKKKRILRICCFSCIFLLLIGGIGKFFHVNNLGDGIRLKGFYMEPEDSLDVVMIGASETYTSIAPGILWKDYGFTSYLYSVAGCPISLVKSQIIEVRKRQNPKVIVVEINGAVPGDGAYQTRESGLRGYLDNIPWSENKIQTIQEVVPESERNTYYFPFLKYHSNWKNIRGCIANAYLRGKMNLNGGSKLKGYQTFSLKKRGRKLVDVTGDTSTAPLTKEGEYYLRDLLDYLKEEQIDNVLFVRIPHRVTEKNYGDYQRSNRAGQIIKEYGFPFVNYEYERDVIGLNMKKDFYNDHHMNYYGQKKFTKYFGRYMTQHYDLGNIPHSKEVTEKWDEAARETDECLEYVKELLKKKRPHAVNEGWRESKRLGLKE